MVKVEVVHAKNNLDFSVKVWKENNAPQIFNNLPVVNCLERTGCTQEQIANHQHVG